MLLGLPPVCWFLFYVYIAKERNSCGKGEPFQGPESGLLSNTWKWTVQGDSRAHKARDFIEKGHRGRAAKGTQENRSATWLTVSGFMVSGLVSWLWPIILTHGYSWGRAHLSAKVDFSRKDSGELVGHVDWHLLSPFDFSWILPVGGNLLVPHYFPGPPVVW